MKAWKKRLATIERTVSFDYPRVRTRAGLLEAHRAALVKARRPGERVVLAGKSMGGRYGCHLANEPDVSVEALVCFGYPLVGTQKGDVRDEVLYALRTPVLFVQGTRDPLCPLDLLAEVRAKMRAPSELHIVDGGDHSLLVRKKDGRTQREVDDEVLRVVRAFLSARS